MADLFSEGEIGSGTCGQVFKVRFKKTGHVIAVKVRAHCASPTPLTQPTSLCHVKYLPGCKQDLASHCHLLMNLSSLWSANHKASVTTTKSDTDIYAFVLCRRCNECGSNVTFPSFVHSTHGSEKNRHRHYELLLNWQRGGAVKVEVVFLFASRLLSISSATLMVLTS